MNTDLIPLRTTHFDTISHDIIWFELNWTEFNWTQLGFDQSDFLTCCKFAEGDSRVLMQKMSRDRYRAFLKSEYSKSAGTAKN